MSRQRRPAVRRLAPIAAVAAAVALALSGCGILPFPPIPQPGNTGEDVSAELERFYHQEIEWTECGDQTDCGEVMAPLDWADPGGETITLALARHNASGRPLGSLLINPGGPGGSGYQYVRDYAQYIVTPAVLEAYDVIGFDPRGVGESTPVVCYTDPADQDELLYGTYDDPYGSEGWLAELTDREADWSAACLENTGPLLGHIDAGSVARDMDMMRAVLGDEKLNFLGYSYGTYIGAMYAELFPEKVGRMVLDGAVDPTGGSTLDGLAFQMTGFESAFRAYMEWCLGGGDCPFSGSTDAAMQAAHELIGSVDGKGLMSSDGRELDSATVGTGVAQDLYAESLWPNLTGLFRGLQQGDADPAFAEADSYNGRDGAGNYDNGSDVYMTVTCLEGDLGTDGVNPIEGVEQIEEDAPIIGGYLAYDDYAVLDAACEQWPVPFTSRPETFDAEGADPIVVIGTTNDPATPYANAVSLAEQLSSGVLISYEGEGHTIYAQGVTCVDDAVDDYLIRGKVPSSDPMC
jgi:pimeloyl-ACP methyl ester carboxylesterase